MLMAGNAVDSGAGGFRCPRSFKLIPFYGDSHLELPGLQSRGPRTAQDLAQAVKMNRGGISRKCDDIFNSRAHIDGRR
jgi:hypothetical protein